MKRWAWNIFCAISLLVLVSSVTLWVRSYTYAYGITFYRPWMMTHLNSEHGQVAVIYWRRDPDIYSVAPSQNVYVHGVPVWPQPWWRRSTDNVLTHLDVAGFYFGTGKECRVLLVFPLWLFLPFAIPPILWLRKRWKAQSRGFPVEVQAASPPES